MGAAKTTFDKAIERAEHFLILYTLLHDNRQRSVRSDWGKNFKKLMHWPQGENIHRIDSKDSVLILRENSGLDRERFQHEYVSELLRSAIIAAVSALDRYLHDLFVEHSWKLLSRKEDDIPKKLKDINIPVFQTKKAIDHLRSSSSARPGTIIKKALQDALHKRTFQNPNDVYDASQMIGIKDFWEKLAKAMPGNPTKGAVQKKLKEISVRRNQIVHESDLVRITRNHGPTLQPISENQAKNWVSWITSFVAAFDKIRA